MIVNIYERKVRNEAWIVATGGLAVQLNVLDNRPEPAGIYPPIHWMDDCAYCLDRPEAMPAGSVKEYWHGGAIQSLVFIG